MRVKGKGSHYFESTSRLRALLCRLWQVPSLVIGPFTVHIRLDIHLNSLRSIQPLTCNLAPWLTNLPSPVPISSWVERSNAAWSALLKGTTSSRTGRVLNPGLDLDPNPESCTLPLDQRQSSHNYWPQSSHIQTMSSKIKLPKWPTHCQF